MKIWQIDPANLTPYYNGAVCEALADEGHGVDYFTSRFLYDPTLRYPDSFTTHYHYFGLLENEALLRYPRLRKGLRAAAYPLAHWRLLRQLRRHQPDVVHIQWSRLPIFDRWLVSRIRGAGIPVVHTIHDVDPLFLQGRFTGKLGDVYSQVDALVVHTEDSRKRFLRAFSGIDPARVHTIPMIANPDKHLPDQVTQALARQQLNIAADAFIVLYFGVVKPYKGVDVLAQAIPAVHTHYPDVQFWIVGRPDSEQDRALVDGLRNVKNVHVHAEFVPSDSIWQYHVAADVVVFPYRDIFQSAALISALGYGCPVIVTDVGGLPEAVDGNGWVVPPEDAGALAQAIVEAAADRGRLEGMRARSRAMIDQRHAPASVARQLLSLYRELVG